jgi:hypothetical protein
MTAPTATADDTSVFTDPDAIEFTRTGDESRKARGRILPWVLGGYLVVLAMSIAIPLLIAPRRSGDQVKQVEDLMPTISGLSQGLFGVVKVVVWVTTSDRGRRAGPV